MIQITDLAIIFWTFCIVKAINNALRFDYKNWKARLGIPDKWDWWFNPSISWKNKNKSWLWKLLTPFSDFWHTLWTIWQIGFVIYSIIKTGWINGLLITGVVGVFILFNSIYAFLRKKRYV